MHFLHIGPQVPAELFTASGPLCSVAIGIFSGLPVLYALVPQLGSLAVQEIIEYLGSLWLFAFARNHGPLLITAVFAYIGPHRKIDLIQRCGSHLLSELFDYVGSP